MLDWNHAGATIQRLVVMTLLLVLAPAALAETLAGRVVGVADGDTLTVLDSERHQHKIRLAGIDAPEKGQAYGQASKLALSDAVFGRQVSIEWVKRDRYNRIIGKVLVAGHDAGLQQLRTGMAWHYKQYQGEQMPIDRIEYAAAESTAKTARRGLWRDAAPTPPWEWRRQK